MKIAGFYFRGLIYLTLSITTTCFFAACSGSQDRSAASSQQDSFFKPPASTPRAAGAQAATFSSVLSTPTEPLEPIPTPTPFCSDNLLFLEDLTIPDGTVVAPGSSIEKLWQIENNGTCNWGERYRIKLIAGLEMGANIEQALYPARSGTQAAIRIIFTAPNEVGTYRSAWQAHSPEGLPFGDPIFIEIVVENP